VALGLFAEDVSFSYGPLLDEIAALGATHVALVVPVVPDERGVGDVEAPHAALATLAATAEAVRAARRAGLDVALFPIVRLEAPRSPEEWRGTLAPANRDAWFRSYEGMLGDLAALATAHRRQAPRRRQRALGLDGDVEHWRTLVERIRALFGGILVYSANWDHYKTPSLFDLVDEVGVVGYFNLREKGRPRRTWRRWRAAGARCARSSRDGCAARQALRLHRAGLPVARRRDRHALGRDGRRQRRRRGAAPRVRRLPPRLDRSHGRPSSTASTSGTGTASAGPPASATRRAASPPPTRSSSF
jgi:hypothetical protein